MTDALTLAAAAVEWNRARREALDLRQRRAEWRCDNEAETSGAPRASAVRRSTSSTARL